jgi:hypothetical protein
LHQLQGQSRRHLLLALPDEAQPSTDRDAAVPLDYSLQIEAGFTRLCSACASGVLPGKTPAVCKVRGLSATAVIKAPMCPSPKSKSLFSLQPMAISDEPPPRQ